jgi:hypothetical protein
VHCVARCNIEGLCSTSKSCRSSPVRIYDCSDCVILRRIFSPNTLDIMRGVYSRLPEVEVMPLHFASEDLSGGRILAMMKVEQEQSKFI